jgi:anti-sigma regulatory factor (Ser/Thr protein kinase)
MGTVPRPRSALTPGEILVLYTDGLVERAGVPLNDSIDQLLARVRGIQTAEEVCRRAVDDQLVIDRRRDDVALVAVQNVPIPDHLDLRVPAEPRRLGGTRVAVRRWLHHVGAGERELVELTMAVSEACTNAIEHAYSPAPAEFRLEGSMRDREVVLTVTDTGQWREPRGSDRGRGLTIMRAAVDELEIDAGDQGTRVTMRRRLRG